MGMYTLQVKNAYMVANHFKIEAMEWSWAILSLQIQYMHPLNTVVEVYWYRNNNILIEDLMVIRK